MKDDFGYLLNVPMSSNTIYHLRGSPPGYLVGFSGIEIGTAAKKETSETDEDKGEKCIPNGVECEMQGTVGAL